MNDITVTMLDDGRKARLATSFIVEFREQFIIVPKGFVTDFASIPRGLWNILPPWGRYTRAAVVHDYLYATQTRPREECDKIFHTLMQRLKVSWWKRKAMYRAVRMGGMFAWNEHKRRINAEEIE